MSLAISKNLTYEDQLRFFEIVNNLKYELDIDSHPADDDCAAIISKAVMITEELYDLKEEVSMRILHIQKCLTNHK